MMNKRGFTIVELIIVLAILGIIAAFIFQALNPNRIFSSLDNNDKNRDILALEKAFEYYMADNEIDLSQITALANNKPYMIVDAAAEYNLPLDCNQAVGPINTTTISYLIPGYLATVPVDSTVADPSVTGSGYFIMRKNMEMKVHLCTDTYDFNNGLVALWHMDESSWSGAGAILDSIGTNHLTAMNSPAPISTDPKMGLAAGNFNVAADAYAIKNSPSNLPSGNVAKTIMAWAKASSSCTIGTVCMIGGFGNTANGENFQMAFNGVQFKVFGWGAGLDWTVLVDNSVYRGSWHQFTLTYNPPTTNFYIDGVLKATTNLFTWNTSPTYVVLGNEIDTNTKKFQGVIDEFAIWNRALSEPEIKAIYNLEI